MTSVTDSTTLADYLSLLFVMFYMLYNSVMRIIIRKLFCFSNYLNQVPQCYDIYVIVVLMKVLPFLFEQTFDVFT